MKTIIALGLLSIGILSGNSASAQNSRTELAALRNEVARITEYQRQLQARLEEFPGRPGALRSSRVSHHVDRGFWIKTSSPATVPPHEDPDWELVCKGEDGQKSPWGTR